MKVFDLLGFIKDTCSVLYCTDFISMYSSQFPWCSGYHICLTHRRSPVRNRAETVEIFLLIFKVIKVI